MRLTADCLALRFAEMQYFVNMKMGMRLNALESEHTDLFGLTDATKTFNSYEDFHSGFYASLYGKEIALCKALVRVSVISGFRGEFGFFFRFFAALKMCTFFFLDILLTPLRPYR